jgi:hypothetical protein
MHGGSAEVWKKNILYRFMKGQTHFGMTFWTIDNWNPLVDNQIDLFIYAILRHKFQRKVVTKGFLLVEPDVKPNWEKNTK